MKHDISDKNIKLQPDWAFVVDITQKLIQLNVKLQEMADLITSLHGNMKDFQMQVQLLEVQMTINISTFSNIQIVLFA
jgi:hypothetical protein